MKIIKKGSVKEKSTKVTCSKCKSILEYTSADIQPDSRDGNYVVCPVCKSFISA